MRFLGRGQQSGQSGQTAQTGQGNGDPCANGHDLDNYTNAVQRVIYYCKRPTCNHTTENLTPEQLQAAAKKQR